MVVVTGASGHIGCNLVRALLAEDRTVRVVVRSPENPGLAGLNVEQVQGDVLDRGSLDRAFRGASIVFHLAAKISIVGDPDGSVHATNVEGPHHVASAALAAGVRRLVHVSSCHAFNLEQHGRIDETSERAGPGNAAYDRSKAAGEVAVREVIEQGLDAVIVNPSGVIGPHDYRPSRMGKALLDVRDCRLPALVRGGFDFVDVRDVVSGMLAAEARGRTGESYLLGGQWIATADLMRLGASVCGVQAPRWTAPMWLAGLGAPFMTSWAKWTRTEPLFTAEALRTLASPGRLSIDKAREELDYSPRPMEQTLRDTYAFFEEHRT